MELDVLRYNSAKDFTDGLFFINGKFEVFTLEDEYRAKKIYGETRIAARRYQVVFRKEGGFHQRYHNRYNNPESRHFKSKDWHQGMLHIINVPNFKYVLIHVGNDDDDTAACLLVGMTQNADKEGFIGSSRIAYEKIYPTIRDALLKGEKVYINYIDYDDYEGTY